MGQSWSSGMNRFRLSRGGGAGPGPISVAKPCGPPSFVSVYQ